MIDLKMRAEILTRLLRPHTPILTVARELGVGRNTISAMLGPLDGVAGLRRLVQEGSTLTELALLTYGNHRIPPEHIRSLVIHQPCPTCAGKGVVLTRATPDGAFTHEPIDPERLPASTLANGANIMRTRPPTAR